MAQLVHDVVDDVQVVVGVQGGNGGQAGQGNGAPARLQWTNVMSGFVLRRFSDLVGEGVKTDKGFKDVHLNRVAKDLTEFTGNDITGTQVYNHLRKWRARWVKICRLKELSGSLWDEENFMITLAPEHYAGHVKDHPKDAEFLNVSLINYVQMQTIFASGGATGRYAMGSAEPLGEAPLHEPIDVDADVAGATAEATADGRDSKGKVEGQSLGKRKRGISEDEAAYMTGLTDAVWGFVGAVKEATHAEGAPGIVKAVMGCQQTTTHVLFGSPYGTQKDSTWIPGHG